MVIKLTKREIKILFIFVVVFLVMFSLCYIIVIREEQRKKSFNASVIVDGNRFFQYKDLVWSDLKRVENLKNDQFKVYSDNNYLGDYLVTFTNNKYYFFDLEYNSYDVDSKFLAINKDSNLSIVNYFDSSFDDVDNNVISKYLNSININYIGEYSVKNKYITDLDNDEKEDYIYILCNELYSDEIFYVIFAKVGNKIITINKQINVDDIVKYELMWIFNTSSNKYNDIILGKSVFEAYDYYLYSYDGDKEYDELLKR